MAEFIHLPVIKEMLELNGLTNLNLSLTKPASVTAARAFADDPETLYLIPDAAKRANLNHAFEYFLRISVLGKEEVYATSPNCEGVAIWSDSKKRPSFWTSLMANPLPPLRCGWRFISHQMEAYRLTIEIKKQFAPPHHMYLALLAVDPSHHGKGYASVLLKPMLERLDKDRLPAYLETQNTENVAMYRHFGFELVHEAVFPKTTFPIYCMLRPI